MDSHIIKAHLALSTTEEITLPKIVDKLHDAIVDSYNGESFVIYKSRWSQAIVEYFRLQDIDLPKRSKPNWERIASAILDDVVAKTNLYPKPNGQTDSNSNSNSSHRSNTHTRSVVSSDETQSEASVKHVKLSATDKENIQNLYGRLDKDKMWKLSTGKNVEEQMMKLAMIQEYEHLSHSLILDVRDKCWLDYFSEQEIAEIKNHHAVELPMLPANITTLIDEFTCTPRDKLYDKINEVKYAPNTDEYWVQDTYNDCFRLLGSGFFPLHGVTEQGIAKRMWSFVDRCFDYSAIRCLSGEKCSKASADAANFIRSASVMSRQQSGRKMDYIFMTKIDDVEVGCGECALVGGINTTKELQDAGFKMPKVMRDMLFKIVLASPALLHQVPICGFYIAHNCLTLYVLDSPVGYVTRYDAFNSVQYPLVESMIRGRLALLLPMVYKARLIMENCKDALYNDESLTDFGLGKNHPVLMEPSFVSVPVNIKKRRQE